MIKRPPPAAAPNGAPRAQPGRRTVLTASGIVFGLAGLAAAGRASRVPALAPIAVVSDPGPLDAQLIALCGQFFALCDLEQPMATAPRQADDAGARAFDRCDAEIWPLKEAIAASITTTPAHSAEGIVAKARVAGRLMYVDVAPYPGTTFEQLAEPHELLAMSLIRDIAGQLEPAELPPGAEPPDADLIRICREHDDDRRAYDDSEGTGDDLDALWDAYECSRDVISDAKPQTLAGIVAKAAAAKADAVDADGEESWGGSMGEIWAVDIVKDLLRIAGRA